MLEAAPVTLELHKPQETVILKEALLESTGKICQTQDQDLDQIEVIEDHDSKIVIFDFRAYTKFT